MPVSLKLLNISLVLLCIVTTAFVSMYLSITGGNTALRDTKASRDSSVDAAFDVGARSVRESTEVSMKLLMKSTDEFLERFTDSQRVWLDYFSREVTAVRWDEVKYFTWHRMASYYHAFSLMRPNGCSGLSIGLKNNLQIGYFEDSATLTNPPDGYHSILVMLNYGDDSQWGGVNRSFVASSDGFGSPEGVGSRLTGVNWNMSSCSKHAVATNGSVPDEPCAAPFINYSSPRLLDFISTIPPGVWTRPFVASSYVAFSCIVPLYSNGTPSGLITSTTDLRHVSSYLSTLEIGGPVGGYPSRGRVYITLRSTLISGTSGAGTMLGASHGDVINKGADGALLMIHANESTDPIIRSAASMAHSMNLDIEGLSSSGEIATITLNTSYAPEGEEFYYRVGRLSDEYGVDWYVHVVIDRAYMLRRIDQQVNETHQKIIAWEDQVDGDLRRSRTVLHVSVVAVAVGLIALSTIFVFRIIEPLVVLEREMAAVAVMRLEDADTERPLSHVTEVRLMQQNFVQMIRNLVEYRNYMPASILQSSSDSDESEGSSVVLVSSRSSSFDFGLRNPHNIVSEVHTKRVTLMTCNIVDFLHVRDSGRLRYIIGAYLSAGLQYLKQTKGIPDSFSGDRLYASWNGVRACASHRFAAYQCAKDICADKILDIRLSIGIVSGEVRCGNMGCDGMKRFSYIGSLSSWVHVVERIGRSMECEVAVDAVVNEAVRGQVYTRMLQHVIYPKRDKEVTIVHEAMGEVEQALSEEEWMYELEDYKAADPYKAYNRSYELFMEGKVVAALHELGDYDDGTVIAARYKERLIAAERDRSICEPLGCQDEVRVVTL